MSSILIWTSTVHYWTAFMGSTLLGIACVFGAEWNKYIWIGIWLLFELLFSLIAWETKGTQWSISFSMDAREKSRSLILKSSKQKRVPVFVMMPLDSFGIDTLGTPRIKKWVFCVSLFMSFILIEKLLFGAFCKIRFQIPLVFTSFKLLNYRSKSNICDWKMIRHLFCHCMIFFFLHFVRLEFINLFHKS